MPEIDLTIDVLDPTKPDVSQWPDDIDAMVDEAAGDIILRQPVKLYTGGAAGQLFTFELEETAYHEIADTSLEKRIKTNQRGGNGKYTLIIIDSSIKSNREAEIRARKEGKVIIVKRGSFSFDTEVDGFEDFLGSQVRLFVRQLKIDVSWPIQHVDMQCSNPILYSINCAPRTPESADDLVSTIFQEITRQDLRKISVGPVAA